MRLFTYISQQHPQRPLPKYGVSHSSSSLPNHPRAIYWTHEPSVLIRVLPLCVTLDTQLSLSPGLHCFVRICKVPLDKVSCSDLCVLHGMSAGASPFLWSEQPNQWQKRLASGLELAFSLNFFANIFRLKAQGSKHLGKGPRTWQKTKHRDSLVASREPAGFLP